MTIVRCGAIDHFTKICKYFTYHYRKNISIGTVKYNKSMGAVENKISLKARVK
jgi:hypothetical protein